MRLNEALCRAPRRLVDVEPVGWPRLGPNLAARRRSMPPELSATGIRALGSEGSQLAAAVPPRFRADNTGGLRIPFVCPTPKLVVQL
jgi:hypothetical protein